jgi:hypothetical protein
MWVDGRLLAHYYGWNVKPRGNDRYYAGRDYQDRFGAGRVFDRNNRVSERNFRAFASVSAEQSVHTTLTPHRIQSLVRVEAARSVIESEAGFDRERSGSGSYGLRGSKARMDRSRDVVRRSEVRESWPASNNRGSCQLCGQEYGNDYFGI